MQATTSSQIFEGVVKAIRPFGTFVEVDGEILLVHANDQSWYWPYEPSRHLAVGARIPVWVGPLARYGCVTRIASFRLAFPTGDPVGRIKPGDTLVGPISKIDSEGVSVSFGPAADVDFAIQDASTRGITSSNAKLGERVEVLIDDISEGPTFILRLLRVLKPGEA